MPVRIEAKAAAEAGVPAELILGSAFKERDQPAVNSLLLPEHVGQREMLLLLGGLGRPPLRISGRCFRAGVYR